MLARAGLSWLPITGADWAGASLIESRRHELASPDESWLRLRRRRRRHSHSLSLAGLRPGPRAPDTTPGVGWPGDFRPALATLRLALPRPRVPVTRTRAPPTLFLMLLLLLHVLLVFIFLILGSPAGHLRTSSAQVQVSRAPELQTGSARVYEFKSKVETSCRRTFVAGRAGGQRASALNVARAELKATRRRALKAEPMKARMSYQSQGSLSLNGAHLRGHTCALGLL